MDLKTLLDTPPWDWPSDAGRMFRKILMDQRAQESDRLIAAQLAGDVTVINDDLADCLLAVVGSANEPEQLRAKAAISLGPVLEQAATDGFLTQIVRSVLTRLPRADLSALLPRSVIGRTASRVGSGPISLKTRGRKAS